MLNTRDEQHTLSQPTIIALLRGLSMSSPRCPCPVFCMYLSVEACLSPSLPFAVFALRLVGCDNVCCSSLVLSITAGSGRFPAVNSQRIYVPFGLVNSKKKQKKTLQPVEPLAADHVKADMDRAMCCSGSWGWPFSGVYTGYCLCFYS